MIHLAVYLGNDVYVTASGPSPSPLVREFKRRYQEIADPTIRPGLPRMDNSVQTLTDVICLLSEYDLMITTREGAMEEFTGEEVHD